MDMTMREFETLMHGADIYELRQRTLNSELALMMRYANNAKKVDPKKMLNYEAEMNKIGRKYDTNKPKQNSTLVSARNNFDKETLSKIDNMLANGV